METIHNGGSMLFGTDGIRGVYNVSIDGRLAYRTGLAIAQVFGGGDVVVVRDTRESGAELVYELSRGIMAGGKNVIVAGILPTPAAAVLTAELGAAAGVMITASHNPPEYNGIKIFNGKGLKLSEDEETCVGFYISNPPPKAKQSGRKKEINAAELYLNHLLQSTAKCDKWGRGYSSPAKGLGDGNCDKTLPERCKNLAFLHQSSRPHDTSGSGVCTDFLSGMSIIIDCCHGAAAGIAVPLFEALGARAVSVNDNRDGSLINLGCGALYPDFIAPQTRSGFDLGVSVDGDADRLCLSRGGVALDGESVLYNLSKTVAAEVVVGTILTNSALESRLIAEGRRLVRVQVGDKYIARELVQNGYLIGGEPSGHFIVRPYAFTGDALLSAVLAARYLHEGNTFEVLKSVPQRSASFVAVQSVLEDARLVSLIDESRRALDACGGRLVVRMSGTEPKLRVMAECTDGKLSDDILARFNDELR